MILHCLVPVLFAFYIQGVLKFKCKIQAPKGDWTSEDLCFDTQKGPERHWDLPISCALSIVGLSSEVKQMRRKADQSYSFSVEIKNKRIFTSTPKRAFQARAWNLLLFTYTVRWKDLCKETRAFLSAAKL